MSNGKSISHLTTAQTIFLTAKWRYLAMLNYEIEPAALARFVPAGTELDFWNGKTYVSMVGFLFQNTCLPIVNPYFFKNALNKSIGSGRNVVVLCSLAISRMVWR